MNLKTSEFIYRLEKIFSNIADLLILNTVFIIFSLPVITIGASATALYRVIFVKTEGEKNNLISSFITSFKENFKQSTGIWLILLFLFVDGFILYNNMFLDYPVARGFIIQSGKIACVLSMYIFSLEAYFKNSISQTFSNAIILLIRCFPTSVVFYLLFEISWKTTYFLFPPLFFIIFGVVAYVNTLFLKKTFVGIVVGD